MNLFLKTLSVIVGFGITSCSIISIQIDSVDAVDVDEPEYKYEEWNLKPSSVYDGDTIRVIRRDEELKIRFCGIDAPEKKQKLGIESRDYLRSQKLTNVYTKTYI